MDAVGDGDDGLESAFLAAAVNGDASAVASYLDAPADAPPRARLADGMHLAAANGRSVVCRLLSSHSPKEVLAVNEHGRTPLLTACAAEMPNSDCIRLLVMRGGARRQDMGAIMEGAGHEENKGFFQEAHEEYDSLLEKLLDAAEHGHVQKLKAYLAHQDFDLNNADPEGLTALHWAVIKRRHQAVELLLARGADATLADGRGRTSLHYTCMPHEGREGDETRSSADAAIALAEALLAYSADADALDGEGNGTLHYAVREGNTDMVFGFVLNGADVAPALGQSAAMDEVVQAAAAQRAELEVEAAAAALDPTAVVAVAKGLAATLSPEPASPSRGSRAGGSTRGSPRGSPGRRKGEERKEKRGGGLRGSLSAKFGRSNRRSDPFVDYDDGALMLGGGMGGRAERKIVKKDVHPFKAAEPEPEETVEEEGGAAAAEPEPAAAAKLASPARASPRSSPRDNARDTALDDDRSDASIDSWDVSEEDGSGSSFDGSDDGYDFEVEDGDEFGFEEEEKKTPQYVVIDCTQLGAHRETELKRICDELGLGASAASAIMRKYQWELRELRKDWDDDSTVVFDKSGIQFDTDEEFVKLPLREGQLCSVCMETRGADTQFYSLGCSHAFCSECWQGFLECNVSTGEVSGLVCMEDKCNLVVPFAFMEVHLRDSAPELLAKFQRFVAESWVKEQKFVKFCPAPNCSSCIDGRHAAETRRKAGGGMQKRPVTVKCDCNFKFCFTCSCEAHGPAECAEVQKWNEKFQNDGESQKYMKLYVKQCPNCGRMIKKEGGCNHIWNCPCKFHWCWVCQKAWEGHTDYYSCNLLNKEEKETWQNQADEAKLHLEKWQYYSEKYANNVMSQKLEGKIGLKVESMGEELSKLEGCTPMDAEVLRTASVQLAECRRVLKYTYMHAYFMKNNNERKVFEYRQKQFEAVVDRISEVFELPDAVAKLQQLDVRVRLHDLVRFAASQISIYEEMLNAPVFEDDQAEHNDAKGVNPED